MIRVIQRRLIIPRGDTGVFTIPAMTQAEGAIGVFTIFDPITNTRIFQKQVEIEGENFNISFSHADTVNLKAGEYLWDIKFYKNPILADNKVIDGEEINSYYAAFQAPKCEIRETGDDFLMIEGQPAKIEDLNIILGATEAANAAKVAATEQAGIAATKAEEAAAKLEEMKAAMPTKVSELENDSGYLQEETDPTVPAWAKAAEKPTYTAQEVGALPSNTFIPSKVSDLTDDSGHYTKPASGIPASDLEETYLTEHQDLSNYVQKTDYANTNEAGVVKVNALVGGISRDSDGYIKVVSANNSVIKTGENTIRVITPSRQHESTFFGLAKAAGSDEKDSELPVGQYTNAAKAAIQQMLDVPSTADIPTVPTNVSAFTNDVGYLTEHQDISGKANVADLAAVATSGSYEDLEDKPIIPEVPVQDVQINGSSILENKIANIQTTSSVTQNSEMLVTSGGVNNALNAILSVNSDQIKAGMHAKRPISPNKQHESTFYGLAKAAGDTTQSQSSNAVGAYTDSAKTAIQTMLDVPSTSAVTSEIAAAIGNINSFDMAVVQTLPTEDISTHTIYLVPKTGETNDVYDEYVYINNAWEMVGNTQIDLSNYVQKTDYATSSVGGVVKVNQGGNYGLGVFDGELRTMQASDILIKYGTDTWKHISPAKQHTATFYGLAKAAGDTTQSQSDNVVGTYTTEAKAAIRSMIGAAASADVTVQDVQVDGTSIVNNGIANIPHAGYENGIFGVVSIGNFSASGLEFSPSGLLRLSGVSDEYVKAGQNYRMAITPSHQHVATFYGLAKAAGDATQSQSDNAVGTYTAEAKAAIQTMLDVPSTSDIPDVSVYATKADTVLDTTLSIGRLADSDVGENSIALGYDVTASGDYSFATGSETIASSDSAHAEGENTQATDSAAHAEGTYTQATGYASHAEGDSSVANGWFSHAEGSETAASGRSTHVFGERNYNNNKYPSEDNEQRGTMVEIVGNGQGNGYSNARALTWTGDEYLAGNLYVNANATSTSGTRVATVTELAAKLDAADAGLKVVRLI